MGGRGKETSVTLPSDIKNSAHRYFMSWTHVRTWILKMAVEQMQHTHVSTSLFPLDLQISRILMACPDLTMMAIKLNIRDMTGKKDSEIAWPKEFFKMSLSSFELFCGVSRNRREISVKV